MTNTTTTATYNPSELEILGSLEADPHKSFEGHVFHDRVCLLGHKNSGPVDLDLTGAVFECEMMLSLTTWRNITLRGAIFRAGLILSWCTASKIDLQDAKVYGVTDLIGIRKGVFNCKGAELQGEVFTESRSLQAQIRKETGANIFSQPERIADAA